MHTMNTDITYRIMLSGGGTGGHTFPAIAIARELEKKIDKVELLFVGATGRMEMEKVPAAGYAIKGLPISGLSRSNPFKNIKIIFKLFKSMRLAKKIIKEFKPDVVIGVGGYASAPTLRMASKMKIPVLIQEQNSYAGLTNKWLSKKAQTICVAYKHMENYFPKEKIVFTGNPIRPELLTNTASREEALAHFGLSPQKKTLLILGGSLGARSINLGVAQGLTLLTSSGVQIIWQTGKGYIEEARRQSAHMPQDEVVVRDFIQEMPLAFHAADLVVSRAGASTISELCALKKPTILIPSPNVAEDHQTKNAMALSSIQAAIFIKDHEAPKELMPQALNLIVQDDKLAELSANIQQLAKTNAGQHIVEEIIKLLPKVPSE